MTLSGIGFPIAAKVCEFRGPPTWSPPGLDDDGEPGPYRRVKCEKEAVTVDFVCGFRCALHPPRWNQVYARSCHQQGRSGTADTYRRTMISLLTDSILARHMPPEGEEVA